MRPSRLALLCALLATATTGCVIPAFISAFTDTLGRKAALAEQQREYTRLVRWNDLDAAAQFVDPELREEFLSYAPAFENIRVTDFEIGQIDYDEEETSATVRVSYHAYSLATMLETEIRETQQWVRQGKGNTWWVRPSLEGLLENFPTARR